MRLFFCSQFSNTCSYKMDRLDLFFPIETFFRLFIKSHKIQKSNVVFGFQFSTPSYILIILVVAHLRNVFTAVTREGAR